MGKENIKLEDDTMDYLMKYDWPGNVREIRNFVEKLCVISKKQVISLEDIQNQMFHLENYSVVKVCESSTNEDLIEREISKLDYMERDAINKALINSKGNITKAAMELGISRTTIWRKMKRYEITVSK